MSSVCDDMRLVFFDLDTSGLDNKQAEVLGIAAKSDSDEFRAYIMPTNPISEKASSINKLAVRDGGLYYKNTERLSTVPRREALMGLLQYLRQFKCRCLLIEHNWPFHRSFLMPMIIAENLREEFAAVIAGFADTLEMLGQKFPERCGVSGALTLPTLVAELGGPTENVRQARSDVGLLEMVAYHHFTRKDFVDNMLSFDTQLYEK